METVTEGTASLTVVGMIVLCCSCFIGGEAGFVDEGDDDFDC
jgi:hypothetical protein